MAQPATKLRLIAVGVGLLLLLAGGALMVGEDAPTAPEALPTASDATAEVKTLPLPGSQEIIDRYGGLSKNTTQQSLVTRVGNHVASGSDAAKMAGSLRFYVLADENRINVFAMPDGTIFITALLLNHLKTEGQLAAMLAHEIAQVANKHKPAYLATGEIVYSHDDEIVADAASVKFTSQAGYDPNAYLVTLMALRDINYEVPVEFFVTHPSPVNRVARIEYAIKQQFPDGVPEALSD